MAALTVDRLHARYDRADQTTAARLDAALGAVAETALDGVLLDRVTPAHHAVCIREVDAPAVLDVAQPVHAIAARWAVDIADALERAIAAGGDDVVVYPREADAVADLVRGVAVGREARAWAWELAGVLRSGRRADWDAVADALAAAPQVAIGALAQCLDLAPLPLEAGWLRLAAAVQATVGAEPQPAADGEGRTGVSAAAEAVRRWTALVPPATWVDAPPTGRRALAVLVLAGAAPAECRSGAAIAAVAAMGAQRPVAAAPARDRADPSAAPAPSSADGTADAGRPGRPDSSAGDTGPTATTDREPSAHAEEATGRQTTALGGVLFLLPALAAVGAPDEIAAAAWRGEARTEDVLAHLIAGVSGAPLEDAAVRTASGWDRVDERVGPAPLPDTAEGPVAALADEVRTWVADRLPEEDRDDLGWLWARPAGLDRQPGWIEAAYRLTDVDLRIRVAGLDLDPGWVWWLGAVVRFRYA